MEKPQNDVTLICIVFGAIASAFLGLATQNVAYAGALSFALLSIILMLMQISRK